MRGATRDAATPTARARRRWDKQARHYDREMRFWERLLFKDGREWACSPARGDVLEIAGGTGRNLSYYPSDVRLTGIELSPNMLDIARERARQLGREADLRLGDAQALDLPDDSVDTVVCTLSLCSIPDPVRAVEEARRVLRPGGTFILVEHVRSRSLAVRIARRIREPLAALQGDSLLREPLEYLRASGFSIEVVDRSKWSIVERVRARKAG